MSTLSISYVPSFDDPDALARYRAQAAWHLKPLQGRAEVGFAGTAAAPPPSYVPPRQADIVLFWRADSYWAAPPHVRAKGVLVDELTEPDAGNRLDTLVTDTLSPDVEPFRARYRELLSRHRQAGASVNLIGSGPRAGGRIERADSGALNIYLGTSVFSDALLGEFRPDIVVAADGPSQFGVSQTATRFRQRMTEILRRGETTLIVPMAHYLNIAHNWEPDILGHVLPIPVDADTPLGTRFSQSFSYRPTTNILTSFGLPLALDVSDEIDFVGITLPRGAEEETKVLHWTHAEEVRYQRHVADMMAQHPAAMNISDSYLADHMSQLSQILAAAQMESQAAGCSFRLEGRAHRCEAPGGSDPVSKRADVLPGVFRIVEAFDDRPIVGALLLLPFVALGVWALKESLDQRMFEILVVSLAAVAIAVVTAFLRARMNRRFSQLERRLVQQQAHQFANVSSRLEAIENGLVYKDTGTGRESADAARDRGRGVPG